MSRLFQPLVRLNPNVLARKTTITIKANTSTFVRRHYATDNTSSVRNVWGTIRHHPNSGLKYLGAASALALGAWVAYSASRPASYVSYQTRETMANIGGLHFSQIVRERIMKTYAYLSGSILLTGTTAFLLFSRGYAYRILTMSPLAFGIGSLIATWGAIYLTMALPYDSAPVAKHAAWIATNGLIGVSILGLSALAGAVIVKQAAMITGCIVGGMSLASVAAPNDTFLQMGPYLGVGLGVVIAASLGGMFFPYSSLLMNVSLYGGLGLFGLFTAHDTQRVLHDAQVLPYFDPISEQMGLYLDTINIFVRVVQILMMQNAKKKIK